MAHQIVLASRNPGKVREMQILLEDLAIEVVSVSALAPNMPDTIEDKNTFEGNAMKKAREVSEYLGLPALADDSGLEVDALDGAPGVFSARYAGIDGSREEIDQGNNERLLSEMLQIQAEKRSARFRSVLAFCDLRRQIEFNAHGTGEGKILAEPRGSGGVGYDPLFFVPELGKTFAELGVGPKNLLSHRAKAMKAIKPRLARYLGLLSE